VFDHTDDYPRLFIQINLSHTVVIFSSESQGEGYTPWQVTVGEVVYITDSIIPAEALTALAPYLKPEGLEDLLQQAR